MQFGVNSEQLGQFQFQLCTLIQRLVLLSPTQICFEWASHSSLRSKCLPGASTLRETRVCGHKGNKGEQKMKRGEGVGVRRKRSGSR